jgi:hypothetical protein
MKNALPMSQIMDIFAAAMDGRIEDEARDIFDAQRHDNFEPPEKDLDDADFH